MSRNIASCRYPVNRSENFQLSRKLSRKNRQKGGGTEGKRFLKIGAKDTIHTFPMWRRTCVKTYKKITRFLYH